MNPLPGTYEKRIVARSAEQLAELVLASDRTAFEAAVLKLWTDHVARVCAQAAVVWLELEGEP